MVSECAIFHATGYAGPGQACLGTTSLLSVLLYKRFHFSAANKLCYFISDITVHDLY